MQTLGETADGEIPEALGQKDGLDAVEQLEVTWPVGAARQEIFGCRPQAWNYGFRHERYCIGPFGTAQRTYDQYSDDEA